MKSLNAENAKLHLFTMHRTQEWLQHSSQKTSYLSLAS